MNKYEIEVPGVPEGYYFLAHSRTFGFASSAAAVHLGNKIWRKVKEEE